MLDLTADFTQRQLTGRASLRLRNLTGANRLVLDTRNLDIRRVTLDDGKTEARFKLGDEVKFLGRPLEVEITPATTWVNIDYTTKPEAAALQWLTPEQAGSPSPFLYTQSEAILARTWVPCQDSPGVRMTYEATIHAPRGLMAVMSAENPTRRAPTASTASRCRSASPPTCWRSRSGTWSSGRWGRSAASTRCRPWPSAPPGSSPTRRR